jgi:mannose-6-phosphate isomerase-like protein (cupin superfamily)
LRRWVDSDPFIPPPQADDAANTPDVPRGLRKEHPMKGYVQNLEAEALDNTDFPRVIYTSAHCQLVLMSIPAMGDIGMEVHTLDQFFRLEEGVGEAVLDGVHTPIWPGFAVLVPAGMKHNIVNTGSDPLKLYTLYSPPNHRDGVVHKTRADALKDKEHFDGKTSEPSALARLDFLMPDPPPPRRLRLSFNFAAPRSSPARFVQG